MEDKNKRFEIKPEEALVDGLAFISQKLCGFIDGKRSNVLPISELLLMIAAAYQTAGWFISTGLPKRS